MSVLLHDDEYADYKKLFKDIYKCIIEGIIQVGSKQKHYNLCLMKIYFLFFVSHFIVLFYIICYKKYISNIDCDSCAKVLSGIEK